MSEGKHWERERHYEWRLSDVMWKKQYNNKINLSFLIISNVIICSGEVRYFSFVATRLKYVCIEYIHIIKYTVLNHF